MRSVLISVMTSVCFWGVVCTCHGGITVSGEIAHLGDTGSTIQLSVFADDGGAVTNLSLAADASETTPFSIDNIAPASLINFAEEADHTLLPFGTGFWVENNQTNEQIVTICGVVPSVESVDVPVRPGMNYLGYPYPIDIEWTNTTLAASSPQGALLMTWDVEKGAFESYAKTREGWTPGGATLRAGEGFIYMHPGSSETNWYVEKPYNLDSVVDALSVSDMNENIKMGGVTFTRLPTSASGIELDSVTSVNVVGYYSRKIPGGGRWLSSCVLERFEGSNTISSVIGDQLTAGGNPWVSDQLHLLDNVTKQKSLIYKDSSGSWRRWGRAKGGYVISAFVDADDNGEQDLGEFRSVSAMSPLYPTQDVSDVATTITELWVDVPNGDEVGEQAWIAGVPYTIEWSWQGSVGSYLAIEYSLNGYAGPWVTITNGIAKGAGGRGSYEWLIPGAENRSFEGLNSNVVIRIHDLDDSSIEDSSDSPFEIIQDFKMTVPNGGEYWYIGETNVIEWESSFDLPVNVSLYMAPDGSNFSANAGGYLIDFMAYNDNASRSNSYAWATPTDVARLLSTNARIRVQEPTSVACYADDSDGVFTLAGIVITEPAERRRIKRNDPYGFDVEWTSVGAGSRVAVDLSLDGGASFHSNVYSSVANTSGTNVLNWVVTHQETDTAVLRVRSLSDTNVVGMSKTFMIAGVDVLAPNGGEEWLKGTTNRIEWTVGGAGDFVNIHYTPLYTGTNSEWILIKAGAPNSLSYDWVVPDRVSPDARIRITSDEDPHLFSVSDADFSIAGVRVTYPNLFTDRITIGQAADMHHDGAPTRWRQALLEISYDREATWELLGPGADSWTLGQSYRFQPRSPSRQTKVRVTAIGATEQDGSPLANVVDVSDEYFTSAGLLLEGPHGGSTNTLGQTCPIEWVTAGAGEHATITYSSDETAQDEQIVLATFNDDNYPGRNRYDWTIPRTAVPTENAVVRIVSGGFTSVSEPFILRGMRVTQPLMGGSWLVGSQQAVAWRCAGVSARTKGSIDVSLDGGLTFARPLQTDHDLVSVPFYSWNIDADITPTTNAIIRLRTTSSDVSSDVGMAFTSDAFTLRGIKILSPQTGNAVLLGSTNQISFVAADAGATATLLYSADGGATFDSRPIVADMPIMDGMNSYAWAVETDRRPSPNAVIQIVSASGIRITSGVFTLGGILVDRPMKRDMWPVGEVNLISYISAGTLGVADLHLVYEDGFVHDVNGGDPVSGPTDGSTTMLDAWALPASAARGQEVVSNVTLRVADLQGLVGYSEPFKIVSTPQIEIVYPQQGSYLKVGDEVEIAWSKGGHMDPEDFRVFYSRDGFSTMAEIYRDVTFNPSNNTFGMRWLIEDRLGTAQVLVSNIVNSAVYDYSGVFDVVGDLDIVYPNGDPEDQQVHAKEPITAKWWTLGSVSHVDLFYQVSTNDWIKINDAPIPNNGGQERVQTTYQLTVPDVDTDSLKFRVQDSNYTQTFDGTKPGPYDDSDNAFAAGYFTVLWEIGYYDDETGEFRYIDQLSVTDSSGWSELGLSSVDDDGQPILIAHDYPYGVYDTVWYRQFLNDAVDLHWLCNSNQTRRIVMQPLATEPDAHVLADFVFDLLEERLTVYAWIERGGRVLRNPDSATVYIYGTDGTELQKLYSETVLAESFFRMDLDNVLDTLTQGKTYLARVEVEYNKVAFSAAVTYMLSLGAEQKPVDGLIGTVFDNEDGHSVYLEQGTWGHLTVSTVHGDSSRRSSHAEASAVWALYAPMDGLYQLEAWWPLHSEYSTAVPFTITHRNGRSMIEVDQRNTGGEWRRLGLFAFTRGTNNSVRVVCPAGGQVGADAVRLIYFSHPSTDSDGDGSPDGDELVAGTSPTDSGDSFRINSTSQTPSPDGDVFGWNTVSGRVYSVYSHSSLTTPWPTDPVYQVRGTGGEMSYTNTLPGHQRFFKLEVENGE